MPPTTDDNPLELTLLSGFSARLNGRPIEGLSYARMRALLAYLAVEPERAHGREFLAGLLWPENDPLGARSNLRRTLSDLRRVVEAPAGRDLFAADKLTVRLLPGFRLDVRDFGAVADDAAGEERQVALYGGEFLAGLSLPDCPDFENWVATRRAGLHRRALVLLEGLSNRYLAQGEYAIALHHALRHLELEPWDESAHRRIMQLYALNGNESAAKAQYESCRRVLESELGVPPDAETDALYTSILAGKLRVQPPLAPSLAPAATGPDERRQVSVMYCELVAEAEDPDDALVVLSELRARCEDAIRNFSGHVVPASGGGLLAYFGYPRADEHAAYRAVRAALAVCAVPDTHGTVRAGVHTGEVVAGGDGTQPDSSGRTTRVAFKLLHDPAHAAVVVSGETHRLVDGYFTCENLGQRAIDGLQRPLAVYRISGESGARTRLEAAARLTPFAGRHAELEQLTALWREAASGSPRIVLLRGEPGIGKSRLVLALRERLAGEPHAIRELRCFPELAQSPFHPVVALLEGQFGFAAGESSQARFDKMVAYVDARFPGMTREVVSLLAPLLALPLDAGYEPPSLSPRLIKKRTDELLINLLASIAAQHPLLLVIEDLHWIDPSTRELLDMFVVQRRGAILALLTARPEFLPPWSDQVDARLDLEPLGNVEVASIVEALRGDVAADETSYIVSRADGVPLFAEEMVKFSGQDRRAGIPSTLKDLLAARMETLGVAKSVAQLAATLGREFDIDLLRRLGDDGADIDRAIAALQSAGMIQSSGDATFQFKHALTQEAAYDSQAKATRQAAHGRIAHVLSEDFPEVAAMRPELLAHHFAGAGQVIAALGYWAKAGQHAARKSANIEAISHFEAALKLVAILPEGQQRNGMEFNLLVALNPVMTAAKGFGAQEVSAINARIGALAGVVGDSPELFQAKWALIVGTLAATGSRGMYQAAERLQASARGDPVRLIAALYIGANSSFWLGNFAASRNCGEQVMALYRPEMRTSLIEQFGSDLGVFSAAYGAGALWFLGFPELAVARAEWALGLARADGHPQTLVQALCYAAILQRRINRPEAAAALSAESIEIARRHEMLLWIAAAGSTHGWAQVMLGATDEGIAEMQAGFAVMRRAVRGIAVIFFLPLIESYLHLGRHAEALTLIADAQADAAATGDEHCTAELLRFKGECLWAMSPANAEQALACFEEALAVSHRQGALSLELRAATSRARLLHRLERGGEGGRLLTSVYDRYSEGFDSFDLREARRWMGGAN